jgi:hypothetical protein
MARYIGAMSREQTIASLAGPASFDSRRFWWGLSVVVAALTALGGLMWARFGAAIFFDMLAAMQGCF